jgi:hypothetical protein
MQLHTITAGVLEVAYFDAGPRQGPPVVLLHGFPYDVHACRAAGELLAEAGCRVVTPPWWTAPLPIGMQCTTFLSRQAGPMPHSRRHHDSQANV